MLQHCGLIFVKVLTVSVLVCFTPHTLHFRKHLILWLIEDTLNAINMNLKHITDICIKNQFSTINKVLNKCYLLTDLALAFNDIFSKEN